MQTHFFATNADLAPVLDAIETRDRLNYVLTGLNRSSDIVYLDSGRSIPNLGLASEPDSISCDCYLVLKLGDFVEVRTVPQVSGGDLFAVDQLVNPKTISFRAGGVHREGILIAGNVGTASNHPESLKLYRRFTSAIRKSFTKIKAFHCGSEAKRLLQAGCRLTTSVQSRTLYDLAT